MEEIQKSCNNCQEVILKRNRFCPYCGHRQSPLIYPAQPFKILAPSLVYYFLMAILIIFWSLGGIFVAFVDRLLIAEIVLSGFTLLFFLLKWQEMRPLLSFKRVHHKPLFEIMAICAAGGFAVFFLGSLMLKWVGIPGGINFVSYFESENIPFPFFIAILSVCVQPAIFEEFAFRGFIHSACRKLFSARATIITTSALFGIIHFGFLSFLWLIPLALLFGSYRERYQSLWYSMAGHFVYNFTIVASEYWVDF